MTRPRICSQSHHLLNFLIVTSYGIGEEVLSSGSEQGARSQDNWVLSPALPQIPSVTLGKSLHHFMPQFPQNTTVGCNSRILS